MAESSPCADDVVVDVVDVVVDVLTPKAKPDFVVAVATEAGLPVPNEKGFV